MNRAGTCNANFLQLGQGDRQTGNPEVIPSSLENNATNHEKGAV